MMLIQNIKRKIEGILLLHLIIASCASLLCIAYLIFIAFSNDWVVSIDFNNYHEGPIELVIIIIALLSFFYYVFKIRKYDHEKCMEVFEVIRR